jgi:hypothetical protein
VSQAALLSATGEPNNAPLQWRADSWPNESSNTLVVLSFITANPGKTASVRGLHVFVLERNGASVTLARAGRSRPLPAPACTPRPTAMWT